MWTVKIPSKMEREQLTERGFTLMQVCEERWRVELPADGELLPIGATHPMVVESYEVLTRRGRVELYIVGAGDTSRMRVRL